MEHDMTQSNATLLEFERLIAEGRFNPWKGTLRTGIDLGTANIVLAVVDEENRPVAGATFPSTVVRDGIVVDYMGAVRAVTRLKGELEGLLGVTLDAGACAIPPGILSGNVKAIGNVVEAANFRLTEVVDEPTAAASVLDIRDGAVVDVGGGTTGISILKDGKVISASVSIHTGVCPECGRTYVSGGTTHTQIKYYNEDNPYQQNLKSADRVKYAGMNLDYAA